ncbi:M23 family metallopeptidase [Nocardia jinanensis]|uniref:Peptidase n=1 Tax=Nocardia jinanensis TaxID=382504 RepID=A0A917R691_9NOCA|nr:M23 family metallopeptidase [Nocardia jinanensis]GGK92043.1 peptidase [Nocardia jinanensis]
MPVTLPLPFRKFTVPPIGRRHITTQVVATSTALCAGFALFAAGTDSGNEQITPVAATSEAPADTADRAPAERPAISHDPAAWDPHQAAADHQPVPVSFPSFEPPRPTTVYPADGVVSSGFGARWGTAHNGIDFAAGMGSPIRTVTDGVVIEAGPATGFGLWVRVQQDDGSVGVYGHMQDILVSVGQQVSAGDVIATVGSRGQSTGPHLHYEVHQPGVGPVDPAPYLAGRGLDLGNIPD